MSVLAHKNILVVGEKNSLILELERLLVTQQMNVISQTCAEVTVSDLLRHRIDVILISHLQNNNPCTSFFVELKNSRFIKEIPIFALVEDNQNHIKDVLMMGAADYFTETEDAPSVIKKIRIMLGESDNLSSNSLLEVPTDIPAISIKGRKVFVIEDDSLLRNLLASKLTISSLPFDFATSGVDALEKVRAYKPNIIILDLMLPVRDGFELLADLKADSSLSKVPVIVFSNRDSEEDKKRAFALGAERYYVKAMTELSTLISAIDELS